MGLLDAYDAWSDDDLVKMTFQPTITPGSDAEKAIQSLMTDPGLTGARAKTVAFVRRKVLKEQERLDPSWMMEMTRRYGPLDWRLPWTLSLYWSSYGAYHCHLKDITVIESLNNMRMAQNNLRNLTRFGRLALIYEPEKPDTPLPIFQPDWRYIEPTNQAYLDLGHLVQPDQPGQFVSFREGHVSYLDEAVVILWMAGRRTEAQSKLQYLRDLYKPDDPVYQYPADQFVFYQLTRDESPNRPTTGNLVTTCCSRPTWPWPTAGRRTTTASGNRPTDSGSGTTPSTPSGSICRPSRTCTPRPPARSSSMPGR